MLPPDKSFLSQVYKANDVEISCRVCSTGHKDTYIFRKGWPVAEIVDVEPEESARLVAEGACVCLCNRCGQAFRKRAAVLNAHQAMLQMISEYAQDDEVGDEEGNEVEAGDVGDAWEGHPNGRVEKTKKCCTTYEKGKLDEELEVDKGSNLALGRPIKRHKSMSNRATVRAGEGGQGLNSPAGTLFTPHKPKSKHRAQTQAEKEALMAIAAASLDPRPTEYTGYGVTKTVSDQCRFTFFWLHKNNRTKPLLVSVGMDKRKSGHFTYQQAPGLPESVPALHCTSRRQVLAWMLTHFSVPNKQLNARLRKQLPVISLEEAHALVGSDPPGVATDPLDVWNTGVKSAIPGQGATIITQTPSKLPTRSMNRSGRRSSVNTAHPTKSTSAEDASEGSERAHSELPSPLSLLNISFLDVPSPSDLALTIPSKMVPTSMMATNTGLTLPTLPNIPTRSSEEPDMVAMDVMCAPVRCGACGLGDHETPDCPFQGGDGVSISSPNTSRNGSDGTHGEGSPLRTSGSVPVNRTADGAGEGLSRMSSLCEADGAFSVSSDLLHNIGCWSELNSPEKTENHPVARADDPPSTFEASSLSKMISVLIDPKSHVDEIESALEQLNQLRLSLKELADSGIVGTVAQLLASSTVKRVVEAARAICHKWLSQAEAAVQEISYR